MTQSLGAWLHQAATNLAVDAIRSDSARRRRERIYAEEFEATAEEVVEVDSWIELSPIVDEALQELPEGCRTIFALHEVEGYQHHEIAQLLDCSIGNSKSQLHKAKLKMRALLFPKTKIRRRAKNAAKLAY